ncbi:MAG TPA: hypothetical protein VHV55_02090, partial [Pirellulales bacterium]|nr:hypothetical protein [Pirellulales bacterium]
AFGRSETGGRLAGAAAAPALEGLGYGKIASRYSYFANELAYGSPINESTTRQPAGALTSFFQLWRDP